MKTGDTESRDFSTSSGRDENVVRLPREWIGPLEDLVPIRPASATDGQPAESTDNDVPPTADAFWSEDAGALHDAVQAPSSPTAGFAAAAPAESSGPGTNSPRRAIASNGIGSLGAIAWRAVGSLRAVASGTVGSLQSTCGRMGLRQIGVIAIAVPLVLLALLATVWQVAQPGAPASRTRHELASANNHAVRSAGSRSIRDHASRARTATASARTRRSSALKHSHPRSTSGHPNAASRKMASNHPPRAGGSASHVNYAGSGSAAAASAPPADSGASSTYSPPAAGASTSTTTPPTVTTTTPATQPTTGAAGSAAANSGGAGSTPALGSSGALAPGSSPNS